MTKSVNLLNCQVSNGPLSEFHRGYKTNFCVPEKAIRSFSNVNQCISCLKKFMKRRVCVFKNLQINRIQIIDSNVS